MSDSGEQDGSLVNGSSINDNQQQNGNGEEENTIAGRHAQFVQALERLDLQATNDSNSNDWSSRMASELNWTAEQVERHAYRYFTALLASDDHGDELPSPSNGNINSTTSNTASTTTTTNTTSQNASSGSFGSQEEMILLDTLLAQYRPVQQGVQSAAAAAGADDDAWITRVALHFPHKTVAEIQRYIQYWDEKRPAAAVAQQKSSSSSSSQRHPSPS
jgi:hypothetical protein